MMGLIAAVVVLIGFNNVDTPSSSDWTRPLPKSKDYTASLLRPPSLDVFLSCDDVAVHKWSQDTENLSRYPPLHVSMQSFGDSLCQ